MSSRLSQLTIIMPTYKRQSYALRSMSYWSGKDPTVHVLDGTNKAIDASIVSRFPANIHYHHLPISWNDRLNKAITENLIQTDYVLLMADDEFHVPSGLEKCIEEIENRGLVACLGRCLFFEVRDNKIAAYPWCPPHTSFEGYSLLEEDPKVRLIKHMNPYLCTTIYAVTKADAWKINVKAAMLKTHTVDSGELAYEIASSYQGKSMVIDAITWLRSGENQPFYRSQKDKTILPLHKWIKSETHSNELSEYVNVIENALLLSKNIPEKDKHCLHQDILDAIYKYLECAEFSFESIEAYRSFYLERAREVVLQILPKPCIAFIRQIKAFFNSSDLIGTSRDLVEMSNFWRIHQISSEPSEIEDIQHVILNFHFSRKRDEA